MNAHLLIYSLPMEEIREPAKVTRPAREHERDPVPEAVAAIGAPAVEILPDVPPSGQTMRALRHDARRIT